MAITEKAWGISMPNQKGLSLNPPAKMAAFTLVEMVVVVAMIAILAGIAYPSYQNSVIKSNRSAAQQFMLEVANREEQYRVNTRSYGDLEALGISAPAAVSKYYKVKVTPGTNNSLPTYTITAVPIDATIQKDDEALNLDYTGKKTPSHLWP
jgi:type IV pilus assembly protein PilE